MSEELYKKYRPKDFPEVKGQDSAVKVLQGFLNKKKVPHAMLFSGPSGVGKTTLARILANKLGASDWDIQEINSANFRGIDTVRDITKNMVMAPIGGKCRVWIIDECFPAGTKVQTPFGQVNIEDVKPGDVVNNLNRVGVVKNVFRNLVKTERIVRVNFHDGTFVVCTENHEIFTEKGWKKASSLGKEDCVLTDLRYLKHNEQEAGHDRSSVQILQVPIHSFMEEQAGVLQQELRQQTPSDSTGVRKDENCELQILSREYDVPGQQTKNVLFPIVCEEIRHDQARISCEAVQSGSGHENLCLSEREKTALVFQTDVGVQSDVRSGDRAKSDRHQDQKRNVPNLERRARRQRQINEAAKNPAPESEQKLENGSSGTNWKEASGLPALLQTGHCSEEVQNRDRSGRSWAQIEEAYLTRQKEGRFAAKLRVDSVEVYQQGNRGESFRGSISDQQDRQGTAVFYDLEVEGHPSYFANGVPVHNCHKMSGDGMTALLKPLEDTPSHVYFFLCTDQPAKLIGTIKTRTTEIKLSQVSEKSLTDVVKAVAKAENIKMPADVLEKLIENSEGSVRKALVSLEELSHLEGEEEQLNYLGNIDTKSQAFNLLECFFRKKSWAEVAKVLRGIDQDAEGIRQMLLASARTMMVGKDGKAPSNPALGYKIALAFQERILEDKTAGQALLAKCCYEVVYGE